MAENQTVWNSDNQGIKKIINQNNQTGVPRQRNTAQMKEQSITSERALNNEDIANLSDGEFKVLVIRMFTNLIELGRKMKKQMKEQSKTPKRELSNKEIDNQLMESSKPW